MFYLNVAKIDLDVVYVLGGVGDPRVFPRVCVKRSGRGWLGKEAMVGSTQGGEKAAGMHAA
jgi:hypothetical protein